MVAEIERGEDPALDSDKDRALRLALTDFPTRFIEGVYIGEPPSTLTGNFCFNGTASLLRLQDRYLCVTCNHVLDEYRSKRNDGYDTHFQIGGAVFDPLDHTISASADLDLVTIELPPELLGPSGIEQTQFFAPAYWPPEQVANGDVVSFAGFPGIWRERPEVNELIFYSFSHGACFVHSARDDYFVSRLEPDKWKGSFYDGKQFEGIGGLSGGPVFKWRRLHADLVGFIVEYQSSFDLLYIRSANVLHEDGSIG